MSDTGAGGPTGPASADSGPDGATGQWKPDFSAPVPAGVLPDVPGVRLDERIGRGGYATVYRGRQLSVDRDVAVKVDDRRLLEDRDKRRFTREIVAAGAVSAHPHIVTVYDGGTTVDDHPYLVMELYPGGSYSDRIRTGGPVPPAEVFEVGLGIADALAIAHADGILHRDVKPGNILISRYGTPALADFGLAALPRAAEGFSVTMESLTPSYAPPEAFSGAEPTAAMDIYSLGATLYALILGRAPRSDKSGTVPPLARLLYLLNEPLPAPEIPGVQALMPVIWRATAFEPAHRYPSAAAMRDDLASIKSGFPVRTSDQSVPSRRQPQVQSHTGSLATGTFPTSRPLPSAQPSHPSDLSSSGPFSLFRNTAGADTTGHAGNNGVHPGHEPAGSPQAGWRRRWWWVGAAAAVAIVLVAGLVVFGSRSSTGGVAQAGGVTVTGASRTSPAIETELSRLRPPSTPVTATTSVTATAGPKTRSGARTSSSSTSPATSVSASAVAAPPVGSCWGGLVDISGDRTASQVPCDEPHYWEAYATGVLDPATPTPYDSDVAKDPVVAKTCTKDALKSYLGAKKHGSFNVDVLPPRDLSFATGKKGFLVHRVGAECG